MPTKYYLVSEQDLVTLAEIAGRTVFLELSMPFLRGQAVTDPARIRHFHTAVRYWRFNKAQEGEPIVAPRNARKLVERDRLLPFELSNPMNFRPKLSLSTLRQASKPSRSWASTSKGAKSMRR